MSQDVIQGTANVAANGHPDIDANVLIERINEAWAQSKSTAAMARVLKRRRPSVEAVHVEIPLADKLTNELGLGIHVERQVSCPGGRIDVLTPDDIFECKATGDERSIFNAARQLRRYAPYFPGRNLMVVVPFVQPQAKWLQKAFNAVDIGIIELDFEP